MAKLKFYDLGKTLYNESVYLNLAEGASISFTMGDKNAEVVTIHYKTTPPEQDADGLLSGEIITLGRKIAFSFYPDTFLFGLGYKMYRMDENLDNAIPYLVNMYGSTWTKMFMRQLKNLVKSPVRANCPS